MAEQEASKSGGAASSSGATGGATRKPKRRKGGFNLLLVILVIAAGAAFAWAEQQRREVNTKLEQTTAQLKEIERSSEESGETIAAEVLEKIQVLIDIPTEPQPAVATITDVDRLREANEFFNKAQNGNFVVLTENRAILYDNDRNIIIDVAPFTVEPAEPADGTTDGGGAGGGATGSDTGGGAGADTGTGEGDADTGAEPDDAGDATGEGAAG